MTLVIFLSSSPSKYFHIMSRCEGRSPKILINLINCNTLYPQYRVIDFAVKFVCKQTDIAIQSVSFIEKFLLVCRTTSWQNILVLWKFYWSRTTGPAPISTPESYHTLRKKLNARIYFCTQMSCIMYHEYRNDIKETSLWALCFSGLCAYFSFIYLSYFRLKFLVKAFFDEVEVQYTLSLFPADPIIYPYDVKILREPV